MWSASHSCFLFSPQILIPALMVTAEKDFVLVPQMSKHMEDWVREWPCTGVIGAPRERARARVLRGKMAAEDTPCHVDGTAVEALQ